MEKICRDLEAQIWNKKLELTTFNLHRSETQTLNLEALIRRLEGRFKMLKKSYPEYFV
jgi:hypothetical protein